MMSTLLISTHSTLYEVVFMSFIPSGVIPAVLLPFFDDLSIDEASFRAHLEDVASVKGLSALTINAHSTEVASCTFEEQKRVLEITKDQLKGQLPIVHGIYAEGSLEAAKIARMASDGGSSALLVFPPGPLTMGQRPEMVVEHFKRISDASGLPIIAFQYPLAGGQGYPLQTLHRLFKEVPAVRAIKDWCSSPVQNNDLKAAKLINDRIYPLAQVFYADPWVDMHNRMKEALVLLGKLPRAVVRPPLMKVTDQEIQWIKSALIQAGLLTQEGKPV